MLSNWMRRSSISPRSSNSSPYPHLFQGQVARVAAAPAWSGPARTRPQPSLSGRHGRYAHFTSPEYERWVQEAAEETQRARARAASRDDERAALEAEVRTAEKRVENVMESMASLGSNDLLAAKFRAEEKRLPRRAAAPGRVRCAEGCAADPDGLDRPRYGDVRSWAESDRLSCRTAQKRTWGGAGGSGRGDVPMSDAVRCGAGKPSLVKRPTPRVGKTNFMIPPHTNTPLP